jgi:hypothetical protein
VSGKGILGRHGCFSSLFIHLPPFWWGAFAPGGAVGLLFPLGISCERVHTFPKVHRSARWLLYISFSPTTADILWRVTMGGSSLISARVIWEYGNLPAFDGRLCGRQGRTSPECSRSSLPLSAEQSVHCSGWGRPPPVGLCSRWLSWSHRLKVITFLLVVPWTCSRMDLYQAFAWALVSI